MNRLKTFLFYLSILLMCTLVIASVSFVHFFVDGKGPLKQEITVLIPKGTSVGHASQILMYQGVTGVKAETFRLFKLAYKCFFNHKPIHAGEYIFEPGVTPRQILTKMTSGDVYYRKLTIPEGLTTQEILQRVTDTKQLTGEVPGDINEGELLPETYLYTYGDDRLELVKRMYIKHYQLLETLWQNRADNIPISTKEEALTLASIVEKETGIPQERGQVAAVYTNRLRKNMKLQADPTVVYGITLGKKELGRELTRKDLNKNSPYNTYRNYGLPPGPICNPGKASIEAVLNPPESNYYYFVADGETGGHRFAKTLEEHNRNVVLYRTLKKKNKK